MRGLILLFWLFLALLGRVVPVVALEADEESIQEPVVSSVGSDEKPIALVAMNPSRVDDLISWLTRNAGYLAGRSFLVPSPVAERMKWTLSLSKLNLQEISGEPNAFDILLSGLILDGQVSKVIVFQDATAHEILPNVDMLCRACQLASVPLAMNEATADLVIRTFAGKTRMAYLIFNPVAGQGNPEEELALIYNTLEPQIALTVVMTERDVDPAVQAKQLVDMIQARPASADSASAMILASGGDGTVSAVAGATEGTGIPFGVIPRGTANAFSVGLGIPTDVKAACLNIIRGHTRNVDMAMANDVPMILLAGIGFEAGMVENAPREIKDVIGPLAYVLGGVKQFFNQEMFKCAIDIDGEKSELMVGAITVAVVAPATSILAQGFGEVVPDDGLFDVTIATASNRMQGLESMASLLASAVVKVPTQSESLLCVRAASVKVDCDPPQNVVIDGEMLELNPIEFKMLPGHLSVIAPPA